MTWTIYQTVLWLHIFLAIMWFGGLLFVGWGVFPATKALAVRYWPDWSDSYRNDSGHCAWND